MNASMRENLCDLILQFGSDTVHVYGELQQLHTVLKNYVFWINLLSITFDTE